jgi:hypothetical protein
LSASKEVKHMSKDELEKRIEKLEETKMVNTPRVVMWSPLGGGVFGHVHVNGKKKTACSDEEEVKIMQGHYEIDKHRIGKGEEVPFWEYLEAFTYLAPAELVERQRIVIDKLRRMNE